MERLTIKNNGQYVPKKLCTVNRFGEVDDCDACNEYCNSCDKCTDKECAIQECFNELGMYENTGITPEQLKIIDEEYSRMAKELAMLRQQNQWIPVDLELPYVPIGTKDDECPEFNVMLKDSCHATTLKHTPDGAWLDDLGRVHEVVAWMPLPEPYKEGEGNAGE